MSVTEKKYSIGLDFGTNSVRAVIADVADGREVGTGVWDYAHGSAGIILDPSLPNLARQHPQDYLTGIEQSVGKAIADAKNAVADFDPADVIGVGVDTTGSTPMPIDAQGRSLAMLPGQTSNPDAMAWLWKDHTSHGEADLITATAAKMRPEYLAKCGSRYSSEWFWAKILRCAKVAPAVFDAAATWVEIADWIPAVLAGTTAPAMLKRGVCAAGHKAFYNGDWGGYADETFLSALDPRLVRVRRSLPDRAAEANESAGLLSAEWAAKLGLKPGIAVAIGAFDAHLGAVGAGVTENTLVKIMGTSTCDIMVSSKDRKMQDIPGLCGIVPGSVIPGHYGLEAGQSAVGDIFNWFVLKVKPGGPDATHENLTRLATLLAPGASGLLTLDWHNGNRTVLVDQRLTGMMLGLTLGTTPAEMYRSYIEATAFGARAIMERFEEFGVKVNRVVNCGGIAARSPLAMQIYADVMNRPIQISRSDQTCALGSAVAGAVAAGKSAGGYENFPTAMAAMTAVLPKQYIPAPTAVAVYEQLYRLYKQLHDAFGIAGHTADVSNVMKDLLNIRDRALGAGK